MILVERISVSAVKGFRLHHPARVELGSSLTAWLSLVSADYDADAESLRVRLPDGETVEGDARGGGERIRTSAGSLTIEARIVHGPWEEPLSRLAGEPVRLARADVAGAVLFGVYGAVERPGAVRVGDALELR